MDEASHDAAEFLRAVGRSRRCFAELSVRLESRPEVVRVLHDLTPGLAPGQGADCLSVDGYVDAELQSGDAVAWLLDVLWDGEQWTISHWVARNGEFGQEQLTEYSSETAITLSEFITKLDEATAELVASAEDIELKSVDVASQIA